MKANRAYEIEVSREMIEVIEIESGEIALFWDLHPSQTGRMARALRTDLAGLEAVEFLEKWTKWQFQ
ncbi:MAG: hypothetical protein QOF76_4479 [Solirubrobacteraceae bacterium]|jgi:hypothetical protein|nr:hypothetical protein [Solirubrobacteraceae bacterium]